MRIQGNLSGAPAAASGASCAGRAIAVPQCRRTGRSIGLLLFIVSLPLPAVPAVAQTSGAMPLDPSSSTVVTGQRLPSSASSPPGAVKEEINPRITISTPAVTSDSAVPPAGPLSAVADALASGGISTDLTFLDFFDSNPSAGLAAGNTQNNAALLITANIDLQKLAGLRGGSIHYLETLEMLRSNETWSSQIGDDTLGFQYPRLFKGNELSLLTFEQRLLSDRLEIEFGRSNPERYFGLPVCQNAMTCFDDVYAFDAAVVPIIHSGWLARVSYKLDSAWYAQLGGAESNPSVVHTNGYDWNGTGATGELALGEIGYRTDYDTSAYPQRYELVGFYNSSDHNDPLLTARGQSRVFFSRQAPLVEHGTGGILGTAQKLVWRADGGAARTRQPFSLMAYAGFGYSPDKTVAVAGDVYGGLTLQSPFAGRPFDRYGIELHWSRLTDREDRFLQQSFRYAGGSGSIASPNKVIFEVNGHVQILPRIFLEPAVQYVVNPNNYYAPTSRTLARDGVVVTGTLVCALGQILGLSAPSH